MVRNACERMRIQSKVSLDFSSKVKVRVQWYGQPYICSRAWVSRAGCNADLENFSQVIDFDLSGENVGHF